MAETSVIKIDIQIISRIDMVVSNDIEDYINDVKVYLEHNLFHTSYYYVQGEDFLKDVDHFYHPVSNVEVDHEVHDVGNDKDFNCI